MCRWMTSGIVLVVRSRSGEPEQPAIDNPFVLWWWQSGWLNGVMVVLFNFFLKNESASYYLTSIEPWQVCRRISQSNYWLIIPLMSVCKIQINQLEKDYSRWQMTAPSLAWQHEANQDAQKTTIVWNIFCICIGVFVVIYIATCCLFSFFLMRCFFWWWVFDLKERSILVGFVLTQRLTVPCNYRNCNRTP